MDNMKEYEYEVKMYEIFAKSSRHGYNSSSMQIVMEVPHSKSLLERTRQRWKDNIIRYLRKYVNMYIKYTEFLHDIIRFRNFIMTVMSL
jgi:adenylate kinase family enzyme